MATPRLYRVILPTDDLENAVAFYSRLLEMPGELISDNRHYFDCGGTILALVNPAGESGLPRPNSDHVYFAVGDLDDCYRRAEDAIAAGLGTFRPGEWGEIAERPWGERSFYVSDPFGNPACFVDDTTLFSGGRFVP
jgi:catechol 2,3-dioxygenase-like lactoylglutathione lyase family enzyme